MRGLTSKQIRLEPTMHMEMSESEMVGVVNLLAGLEPARLRSVQLLLRMLSGSELSDAERSDVITTLREILDPSDLATIVTAHPIEPTTRERVAEYRRRVGSQIFALRKRAGFTQTELARRCGLRQSHVSRLEAGEHAPNYQTMQRIADALEVEVQLLDPGFPDEFGSDQSRTLVHTCTPA